MKLPIYRHPGIREARMEALYRRLKILGVHTPIGNNDTKGWGCAPNTANPTTVTASATADTDGTASTITPASFTNAFNTAFDLDFLITHIAYSATASADWRGRLKININLSTRRQVCVGSTYATSSAKQYPTVQPIFPLHVPAGTSIDLVLATDDGAVARAIDCYIVGVTLDRAAPAPYGLRTMQIATSSIGPNAAQTTMTSGASAWAFGNGGTPFTSASPCLITAITLSPGNAGVNGVASIRFGSSNPSYYPGYFPHTKQSDTAFGGGIRYDLKPCPILMLGGFQFFMYYAASVALSTCILSVEYIPL